MAVQTVSRWTVPTSLPTRGGWIEIPGGCQAPAPGRRPSPHGEGGLKWLSRTQTSTPCMSLPTRGGWIEIMKMNPLREALTCPSPHGEGGLKCVNCQKKALACRGPSPHGEGGLK